MTETLLRIYANPADAAAVATQLSLARYVPFEVAAAGNDPDTVTDALMKHKVHKPIARAFAAAAPAGSTIVGVHAMFGAAYRANEIFAERPGVNADPRKPAEPYLWDEATPFSCAFRLPVLADPKLNFSQVLGMGLLSKKPYSLGDPGLIDNPAPLSRAIMMPLLSRAAAPLSALLFLPVLKRS